MRMMHLIERCHVALGSLSGVATLLMIALVVPDIILRKYFSQTINGASEANILLLIMMVYIGLAGAQARGAHFRVTLVTDRLSPGVQRFLAALMALLSIAGIGLLAVMTTENAIGSVQRGEASFGVISFPIWPGRVMVALGLWLLVLQLFLDFLRAIFGFPAKETREATP